MPTTLHLAHTSPVNPAGAAPRLTTAQVWTGLQRKVRHGDEFVAPIVRCDVLKEEENGTVVTREVEFAPGTGWGVVTEVCRSYEPCKIDFHPPDGTVITNTLSEGPNGGADAGDLHLTYTFGWLRPDLAAGSDEADQAMRQYKRMANGAVDQTIAKIRELVRSGAIDAAGKWVGS